MSKTRPGKTGERFVYVEIEDVLRRLQIWHDIAGYNERLRIGGKLLADIAALRMADIRRLPELDILHLLEHDEDFLVTPNGLILLDSIATACKVIVCWRLGGRSACYIGRFPWTFGRRFGTISRATIPCGMLARARLLVRRCKEEIKSSLREPFRSSTVSRLKILKPGLG